MPLGFIATHAEDPVHPFQVLRTDDLAAGTSSLRLVIGDQNAGANKLTIGPETAPGTYAEGVVVTDNGRVGIGTSAPHAPLHLPADGLQIGTSATAADNFYVQDNTDGGGRGLRIYNGDAVAGGAHVLTATATGRLGIGTTTPSAALEVAPVLGIRQGALNLSGDINWSSLTFNARHLPDNSGWDFYNSALPVVTLEMDAAGGDPRFEVWSSPLGNNQTWRSRLKVFGHTGDVVLGLNGGGLGVGVVAPAVAVDVSGDVQATGVLRTGGLAAIGGTLANEPPMRVVAGVVDDGGNIRTGSGFTVATTSTGIRKITFTPAYAAPPTVIVSRVFGDPSVDAGTAVQPGQTAVVDQITAASAVIATADQAAARADGAFTFIAIGVR